MLIRNYSEVEAVDVEQGAKDVKIRWVITEKEGAPNFIMRVFEFLPGGYSPYHSHAWEHEVFILSGKGVVVSEDGEHEIGVGDVIFVPGNEVHQFKNIGEDELRFICLVPKK